MLVEKQVMATCNKRQVREPPSVPFIWEERPGFPKKNWKPTFSSNSTAASPAPAAPPVKLIASVPFIWEEKPGTPLPYFMESSSESATPEQMLLITYPSPPICNARSGEHFGYGSNGNEAGEDDVQNLFTLDMEAFDFETDDSYSYAPSLLTNCLVSSSAISAAVPATEDGSDQTETDTPSSPSSEARSSPSSYATGTSSLVGGAFLECLFPLLPAKDRFLEKVDHSDNRTLTNPQASETVHFDCETNGSVTLRPRTLGELILMSRMCSYRRKAVQMKKQNISKTHYFRPNKPMQDLMMKNAFGCYMVGTGSKMIEGLHSKRKNLLRFLM